MRQHFLDSLTEDQAELLYACINKNKVSPLEWDSFKCIKTVKALKIVITMLPSIKEEHKILSEELRLKFLDEIKATQYTF
jgi:hypothetical protein